MTGSTSTDLFTLVHLYSEKSPTNKRPFQNLTTLATTPFGPPPNIVDDSTTDPAGPGVVDPTADSKARVARGALKMLTILGVMTTDDPVPTTGLPTVVAPEAASTESETLPVRVSSMGRLVSVSSTIPSFVPIVVGKSSVLSA